MTSHQLPGAAGGGQAEPYRSIACCIGTHKCSEGVPRKFSADLPLIYEVCQCVCHRPKPTATDLSTRTSRETL